MEKAAKKPRYECPKVVPLGELARASGAGDCQLGSAAPGKCGQGNTPTQKCQVGNVARTDCDTGAGVYK